MSFAENLRTIRQEKHLSQEELAELLNVSRQAVSKWEQGTGYPEVETLLLLSGELNISLDHLMATERISAQTNEIKPSGSICISSPHEGVIVSCYKVTKSQRFKTGKNEPKYALFGVNGNSFWGENTTFLAWYAEEEEIQHEIKNIMEALLSGKQTYELKFSVKTERHFLSIKMIKE